MLEPWTGPISKIKQHITILYEQYDATDYKVHYTGTLEIYFKISLNIIVP